MKTLSAPFPSTHEAWVAAFALRMPRPRRAGGASAWCAPIRSLRRSTRRYGSQRDPFYPIASSPKSREVNFPMFPSNHTHDSKV